MGLHGHATPALLLVIVRLMTHGDFLLLNSAPQLAVGVLAAGAVHRPGVIPENLPYRMEQAVHCQNGRGQRRFVLSLQQDLGKGVALLHRLGQPVDSLFRILGNILPLPVQFAQQVFGAWIACRQLGFDAHRALQYANACGALAVTRRGPMEGTSRLAEIEAFIQRHDMSIREAAQ